MFTRSQRIIQNQYNEIISRGYANKYSAVYMRSQTRQLDTKNKLSTHQYGHVGVQNKETGLIFCLLTKTPKPQFTCEKINETTYKGEENNKLGQQVSLLQTNKETIKEAEAIKPCIQELTKMQPFMDKCEHKLNEIYKKQENNETEKIIHNDLLPKINETDTK